MIWVRALTVRLLPIGLSAGTSPETPPRPWSPWQAEQANWTKSCAPAATCGSIRAAPERAAARSGCEPPNVAAASTAAVEQPPRKHHTRAGRRIEEQIVDRKRP